jgi:hypothetical protein
MTPWELVSVSAIIGAASHLLRRLTLLFLNLTMPEIDDEKRKPAVTITDKNGRIAGL